MQNPAQNPMIMGGPAFHPAVKGAIHGHLPGAMEEPEYLITISSEKDDVEDLAVFTS